MLTIPGFETVSLFLKNDCYVYYKALRKTDRLPVVIKAPDCAAKSSLDFCFLNHEYELLVHKDLDFTLRPIALIGDGDARVLIMADNGAEPLKGLIPSGGMDLPLFLDQALKLTSLVARLHGLALAHLKISPATILFQSKREEIYLMDFTATASVSAGKFAVFSPNWSTDAMPYLSPEQIGGMAHCVDSRSDIYALGITFYQMLTGTLPFQAGSAMEWIHNHIAKPPLPPRKYNPALPELISDIVMKCLSKLPEDRYQTCEGLVKDMEACRDRLLSCGKIEYFFPGVHDVTPDLRIPQKLYGRVEDVERLCLTLERVSATGLNEMELLSGPAGIGKSALIKALQKHVLESGSYVMSGQCEQHQQHIPYHFLIQACRTLTGLLLTSSDEQLVSWQQDLRNQLGANGKVLLEYLPEIESLLQPSLPDLSPNESRNRLNLVFQQFFQTIANAEHPLVLFLDDLQWADASSLKLIHLLLTNPDIHYLLIIGTFESDKPLEADILKDLISDIQNGGITIGMRELPLLTPEDVKRICDETLDCRTGQTESLALFMYEKTSGNPFFVHQLLSFLHEERCLTFDPETKQWHWNLSKIRQRVNLKSMAELLAAKISRLGAGARKFLKLGACLGSRFDSRSLLQFDTPGSATWITALRELIQAELLISDLDFAVLYLSHPGLNKSAAGFHQTGYVSFRFAHDSLRQAACSLLGSTQGQEMHLKIGRLMLKNSDPATKDDCLYAVTYQMNRGSCLIDSFQERVVAAELNLTSGLKAKHSAAYELAAYYFTMGLNLLGMVEQSDHGVSDLPPALWEGHHTLLSTLFKEKAESDFLCNRFESANQAFNIVLRHAETPLEKATVYSFKTVLLTNQGKNREAIRMGLKGLRLLGVKLPEHPSPIRFLATLITVLWRHRQVPSPKTTQVPHAPLSEEHKTISKLIMNLHLAAYFGNQGLLKLLVLRFFALSIQFGKHSDSLALAHIAFGFLIGSGLKRPAAGQCFAKAGIEIATNQNNARLVGFAFFIFGSLINNWTQPARMATGYLRLAYDKLLESGSLVYAGYASVSLVFNLSVTGLPLEMLRKQSDDYLQFARKIKDSEIQAILWVTRQFPLALQGQTGGATQLDDTSDVEQQWLTSIQTNDQTIAYLWYALKKAQLYYLSGEFDRALELSESAHELVNDAMGLSFLPDHYFLYFLLLTDKINRMKKRSTRRDSKLAKKILKKMKKWSQGCPENFLHQYLIMRAEWMRIRNKRAQAYALYLEAIETSYGQGFIQNASIANERMAEFCLVSNSQTLARFFLAKARDAYAKWGATTKVLQLQAKLAHFEKELQEAGVQPALLVGKPELSAVVKASQTIGSEIVLENLLNNLMKVMIEQSDATKGALILKKNGDWMIEAAGDLANEKRILVQSFSLDLLDSTQSPLPLSIFRYVEQTRQRLVLKDASQGKTFIKDPYFIKQTPKSLLCTPILQQGELIGILYLENELQAEVFTPERLEILELFMAQAAISIVNARLYADQRTVNEKLHREINERREIENELLHINEELEQSNRELKDTQSQLIQSAKLASIGELATGMAHELNQPLMYIRNSTQLSLMNDIDKLDKKMIKELLEDIEKSTGSMMNIINHLRDFARHQDLSLEPLAIHDVLDDSLILVTEQLRVRNIQLEKQYAAQIPDVLGNAQQLEQVFINILTNARDAMENQANAKLIIKTSYLPSTEQQGELTVAFIDNGAGISEQDQEKIFDPFFSTKEAGKGTGLGLSISYGIIRDHGGQISVESNQRSGATFRVIMPIDLREVESQSNRHDNRS